jgi:hypothetical protein
MNQPVGFGRRINVKAQILDITIRTHYHVSTHIIITITITNTTTGYY